MWTEPDLTSPPSARSSRNVRGFISTMRYSRTSRAKFASTWPPGKWRRPRICFAFCAIPLWNMRSCSSVCSVTRAGSCGIHILATDVCHGSLQQAERGLFPPRALKALDARQKESYFIRVGDQYLVRPQVRNMVSFAQMNLAENVYMGRFDVIFCIDVLSYFDEAHRAALAHRFHEYLESGGYLFVGKQEPIAKAGAKFEVSTYEDCILYQKPMAPKSTKAAHITAGRNARTEREKKA